MERGTRILIDTNAIIEAHRVHCWPDLVGYFSIETTDVCVEECESGNQQRTDYVPIDVSLLREKIAVHNVDEMMRTDLILREPSAVDIDDGEKDLMAYAITQSGNFFLICSPDKACMKVASKLGFLERLIALETSSKIVGCGRLPFRENHTELWCKRTRTKIRQGTL